MVDLTIRSSNIYFTNLCHDLNISASNFLKKPTIKFGSFLFDLKKNNMKEESIMPWCKKYCWLGWSWSWWLEWYERKILLAGWWLEAGAGAV